MLRLIPNIYTVWILRKFYKSIFSMMTFIFLVIINSPQNVPCPPPISKNRRTIKITSTETGNFCNSSLYHTLNFYSFFYGFCVCVCVWIGSRPLMQMINKLRAIRAKLDWSRQKVITSSSEDSNCKRSERENKLKWTTHPMKLVLKVTHVREVILAWNMLHIGHQ